MISHPARTTLILIRPGALTVVDNVVRGGDVLNAQSTDPSVQGIRRFMDALATDPRVTATAVQTVGSKGYDGFALAVASRPRWRVEDPGSE